MAKEGQISEKILVEMSDKVTTIRECSQLAAWSNVALDDVTSHMESGTRNPPELALYILREWRKTNGQRATVSSLLRALNENSRLRHLTEPLKRPQERTGDKGQTTQSRGRQKQSPATSAKVADESSSSCSEADSDDNQGKELRQGMKLLLNISQSISSLKDVYAIATDLLEDIEPNGGSAWVGGKKSNGGTLDPSMTAHDLLEHWCAKSPTTPYGGRLFKALEEVVPRVASEFRSKLFYDKSTAL